ncbi:hypothetical protein PTSG_11621 [Salpingoeca rosetta]|uniref:C2H2-type domain-containing protein n=1 Tax=Salpingoeca rosetta (strain ATCC 50818 / BSB-021) TaxID=946362 RepID=F2TX14_SALR5|nr:uncharacterized protein PTSG_11621 [Salpingoeca rosetta]EGD75923.1 hypothetical protein PTSG_11621 [Salpingoeca rosetta]|eukprot:XP_004998099.1 hypothetical protein PTSG_11621 [Salpingoeca rosetta]
MSTTLTRQCPHVACSFTEATGNVSRLIDHIKVTHDLTEIPSLLALVQVVNVGSGSGPHRCEKCNKTCRSVRHLKDHIRKSKAHEDEYKTRDTFVCVNCDCGGFPSCAQLVAHIQSNHPSYHETVVDMRHFRTLNAFAAWLLDEQETTYASYTNEPWTDLKRRTPTTWALCVVTLPECGRVRAELFKEHTYSLSVLGIPIPDGVRLWIRPAPRLHGGGNAAEPDSADHKAPRHNEKLGRNHTRWMSKEVMVVVGVGKPQTLDRSYISSYDVLASNRPRSPTTHPIDCVTFCVGGTGGRQPDMLGEARSSIQQTLEYLPLSHVSQRDQVPIPLPFTPLYHANDSNNDGTGSDDGGGGNGSLDHGSSAVHDGAVSSGTATPPSAICNSSSQTSTSLAHLPASLSLPPPPSNEDTNTTSASIDNSSGNSGSGSGGHEANQLLLSTVVGQAEQRLPVRSYWQTHDHLWSFHDIRSVVTSDLAIFGDGEKPVPAISLKLREDGQSINVLTGMDLWLDNLMCNVPEIMMCYHTNGAVSRYETITTEDLPEMSGFDPEAVVAIAQSMKTFLNKNCTEEGHTYWLYKGEDDDIVRLYDFTALIEQSRSLSTDPNSNVTNPFSHSVALLLYKIAIRILEDDQPQTDDDDATVCRLLANARNLVEAERYPKLAAAINLHLSQMPPHVLARLNLADHRGDGDGGSRDGSDGSDGSDGGGDGSDGRRGAARTPSAHKQQQQQQQQGQGRSRAGASGRAGASASSSSTATPPTSSSSPPPRRPPDTDAYHAQLVALDLLEPAVEWIADNPQDGHSRQLLELVLTRAAHHYATLAKLALQRGTKLALQRGKFGSTVRFCDLCLRCRTGARRASTWYDGGDGGGQGADGDAGPIIAIRAAEQLQTHVKQEDDLLGKVLPLAAHALLALAALHHDAPQHLPQQMAEATYRTRQDAALARERGRVWACGADEGAQTDNNDDDDNDDGDDGDMVMKASGSSEDKVGRNGSGVGNSAGGDGDTRDWGQQFGSIPSTFGGSLLQRQAVVSFPLPSDRAALAKAALALYDFIHNASLMEEQTLVRQTGNAHNEMAKVLMDQLSEMPVLTAWSAAQFEEQKQMACAHFFRALAAFRNLRDRVNQAVINCNLAKLMRISYARNQLHMNAQEAQRARRRGGGGGDGGGSGAVHDASKDKSARPSASEQPDAHTDTKASTNDDDGDGGDGDDGSASPHAVASTADRNLHMHAIQYYQQAKDCLARRAVHPQLWDQIQLELGGTHLGFAALLASAAPGLRDDTHVDSYLNSAIAIFADISRNLTSAPATAGRHDNAAWISAMRRAVSLKLGGGAPSPWARASAASKVQRNHLNKALSYYAMHPDETAGLVLQVHFERATLHSIAHGRLSASPSVVR